MANDRENLQKPEFMSEEDWAMLKDQTSSISRIRGDAHADVERYLANPKGWATGEGSPSGLPTLLLHSIGAKSGKPRIAPLVFMSHGDEWIVVGSLAGYDSHPAWVHNINANPKCHVQLDEEKFPAVARHMTDEERAELWPKIREFFPPWGYFQDQTDRPFALVILSRA